MKSKQKRGADRLVRRMAKGVPSGADGGGLQWRRAEFQRGLGTADDGGRAGPAVRARLGMFHGPTGTRPLQLDILDKRGGDVYYICMQLGLRHFGEASLAWFKEKSRDPSATRWSLARGICEREDWRNRQGVWCIASACKALPQLAAHLGVALPAARPVASIRAPASDYPDLALDCALEALGEVSVRRVAAKDVGAFRRLLHTHHPRGWDRSPGAALNCLDCLEPPGSPGRG